MKRPVKCEMCGEVHDLEGMSWVNHLLSSSCYKDDVHTFRQMAYEYYQLVYTLEMMEKWYISRQIKIRTTNLTTGIHGFNTL